MYFPFLIIFLILSIINVQCYDVYIIAVTAGSELSFDYQWPISSRQPTKCFCLTPSCRGYLEVGLDTANPSKKKKEKEKDRDKEVNTNKYEGDDISFVNNAGTGNGKKAVERYNDEYRYGRRRGVWKTRTEIPYIHTENTDIARIETKIDNDNKNQNIVVNENENENKYEGVTYFKEECIDVNDTTIQNTNLDFNTEIINEIKVEKTVKKEVDYTTSPSYRLFLSQWLVGKYVTVMWLKNMRYSEAIVGDYNTEKGQFSLHREK